MKIAYRRGFRICLNKRVENDAQQSDNDLLCAEYLGLSVEELHDRCTLVYIRFR